MKVFITGSTANQTNPVTHERSTNFAGLIREALVHSGVEVVWSDPSVSMKKQQLDEYDKVLVGLSSPLALGSNRIYGALSLIHELWDDPRLALYIDVPDPNNLTRGLDSINRNPKSLTKDFFSTRKDYEFAISHRGKASTFTACENLRSSEWPETLVPGFPWMFVSQFERDLPAGADEKVRMVNLDHFILRKFTESEDLGAREPRWMAERTADKKWLKGLAVSQPVLSLKADHRTNIHPYLMSRLHSATGFLHSPSKRGAVWWSPKVALALSQQTPVFTQWRVSQALGWSWAALPGTFEAMTQEEQRELSKTQYDVYLDATPTVDLAAIKLLRTLGLKD